MNARASMELIIILNMEATSISEMLGVIYRTTCDVIPQSVISKLYLFGEDRMVKVNQVEPLQGSLEPCTCQRETGVVVYLWHPGFFKY
jgi:hypothetical protein